MLSLLPSLLEEALGRAWGTAVRREWEGRLRPPHRKRPLWLARKLESDTEGQQASSGERGRGSFNDVPALPAVKPDLGAAEPAASVDASLVRAPKRIDASSTSCSSKDRPNASTPHIAPQNRKDGKFVAEFEHCSGHSHRPPPLTHQDGAPVVNNFSGQNLIINVCRVNLISPIINHTIHTGMYPNCGYPKRHNSTHVLPMMI